MTQALEHEQNPAVMEVQRVVLVESSMSSKINRLHCTHNLYQLLHKLIVTYLTFVKALAEEITAALVQIMNAMKLPS